MAEPTNEQLEREIAYYKKQLDSVTGISLNDQYKLAQAAYDSSQFLKGFKIILDLQRTFNAYEPLDSFYSKAIEKIQTHLATHKIILLKRESTSYYLSPFLWTGFTQQESFSFNQIKMEVSKHFMEKKLTRLNSLIQPTPFESEIQQIFSVSNFIWSWLTIDGNLWGALLTGRNYERDMFSYRAYSQTDLNILESIGGTISACTQQAQKLKQIEVERLRIARDMHDDIGAELSRINVACENVKNEFKDLATLGSQLDQIQKSSGQVIENIGNVIWALNPINNSLISLIGYIREFAVDYLEMNHVSVSFFATELKVDAPINNDTRIQFFRVVKECLHNIVKHSSATKVEIEIDIQRQLIECRISDNGKGFSIDQPSSSGNGLRNMRQRISETGGTFSIASEPGKGTSLKITVPV